MVSHSAAGVCRTLWEEVISGVSSVYFLSCYIAEIEAKSSLSQDCESSL